MPLTRKSMLFLTLLLGLLAAAFSLSGCLWVGPGPRHHHGGRAGFIAPWPQRYYHPGDRSYSQPYERNYRRPYVRPSG